MKRAILQPADVTGAALADLKQWLGISRNVEDGQLAGLLHASLDLCEGFTGQMPLESVCEEVHASAARWLCLTTAPVRAITAVNSRAVDGTQVPIDPAAYEIDISAEGIGRIRLLQPVSSGTIAVTFVAGIAAEWSALPDALKHGIIRLAAHHYLTRDAAGREGPPASVAALWRPWKRLRLR